MLLRVSRDFHFFFFSATPTTDIYTLSLHDALPILLAAILVVALAPVVGLMAVCQWRAGSPLTIDREQDRKSTRLNSSHPSTSYAVFCLKKKNKYLTILLPIPKPTTTIMISASFFVY